MFRDWLNNLVKSIFPCDGKPLLFFRGCRLEYVQSPWDDGGFSKAFFVSLTTPCSYIAD